MNWRRYLAPSCQATAEMAKRVVSASLPVRARVNRVHAVITGTGYAGRNTSQRATLALSGLAAAAAVAGVAHYTVQPGDTLSGIARQHCGTALDWTGLYAASRGSLGADPNLIYPGQRVTMRCRQASVAAPPASPASPAPVKAAADEDREVAVSHHPARTAHSTAARRQAPVTTRHAASGCYDPSGVLSSSQVVMVWTCAGGPSWASQAAVAVSMCESGHNTRAYNPSGATGLFQVLGSVVPGDLYDAHVNALNAVSKFEASGDSWAQWVCKP